MDDDARGDVREDAFHVTVAAHMAAILTEGFRADRRGVLGTGAYFDLGSDTTGLAPARQRYPAQPLVVFRCAVAVGRVLDFDVAELRARFRAFQRQLIQHLGRDMVLRLGHGGHVDLFLEALGAVGERYHTVCSGRLSRMASAVWSSVTRAVCRCSWCVTCREEQCCGHDPIRANGARPGGTMAGGERSQRATARGPGAADGRMQCLSVCGPIE
jgi:hypothetical protein